MQKLVRLPRLKQHLETQPTYGPQTWQRELSLAEHTLNKFRRDLRPVRRGLLAAVKCYVRKARLFLCTGSDEK